MEKAWICKFVNQKMRIGILVILVSLFVSLFASPVWAFEVSSSFGWRNHPITGQDSFHNGIDIPLEYGEPIPAIWNGKIIYSSWYDGFGNTVIIDHGNNVYTLYGHCSKLLIPAGATVQQGEVIALVGSTGNSTGPHLHLSLIRDNQYIDPMIIWQ